MGALSLTSSSYPAHPFLSTLGSASSADRMYAVPTTPTQTSLGVGASTLLVVAELYQRRGAAVSVNVRPDQVDEDELGAVISISHKPKRSSKRLTEDTDREVVEQLLRKVREDAPTAQMKWNDEERSWYIKATRPKKAKVTRLLSLSME